MTTPTSVTNAAPTVSLVAGPAVQSAGQVALTMSPIEIILMLGTSRPLLDAATGVVTSAAPEWSSAYSFSPTGAKQLLKSLEATVNQYEALFGSIPMDPKFALMTTQSTTR